MNYHKTYIPHKLDSTHRRMHNNLEQVEFSKGIVSWKSFTSAVLEILFPPMTVSLINCQYKAAIQPVYLYLLNP